MSEEERAGRYRQRWVAYLDILGYKDMVSDAVASRRITATIDLLKRALQVPMLMQSICHTTSQGRDLQVRILSDSICITCAPTTFGSQKLLLTVAGIQTILAIEGIFVRGAITNGGHYDDGRLLFSPAMIEAYQIEDTIARYPRVLVPEGFAEDTRGRPPSARVPTEVISEDDDGHLFISYLSLWLTQAAGSENVREWLGIHKQHIENNLGIFRDNPKVHPKYEWLAGYHNRFCREALVEEDREGLLVALPPPVEAER